jgi:hypothetical protein
MRTSGSRTSGRSRRYQITIEGELSERFASEFEGMTLESGHGKTSILGEIVDQSHLYGVLARVQDLGLALVSVAEVPANPTEDATQEGDSAT